MRILVFTFMVLVAACDGSFPRDPEGTSERVQRSRVLRVGATEHAPWIVRSGEADARGPEAELVKRFARSLGARIDWRFGQQEALLLSLEAFELDLVLGGLRKDTLFSEQVGLTRPWFVERWGVGVRRGLEVPSELEGVTVEIARDAMLAYVLRAAGARPRETSTWRLSSGAVAAPLAFLRSRDLTIIEPELAVRELVLATPPGENGWLGAVERYLAQNAVELQRLAEGAWR